MAVRPGNNERRVRCDQRAGLSLSRNILTSSDLSEYSVRFRPWVALRISHRIPAGVAPGKPQWRPLRLSCVAQFGASASNFLRALSCRCGPSLRCVDVGVAYNFGELLNCRHRECQQAARLCCRYRDLRSPWKARAGIVADEICFAHASSIRCCQPGEMKRQFGPDVLIDSRMI